MIFMVRFVVSWHCNTAWPRRYWYCHVWYHGTYRGIAGIAQHYSSDNVPGRLSVVVLTYCSYPFSKSSVAGIYHTRLCLFVSFRSQVPLKLIIVHSSLTSRWVLTSGVEEYQLSLWLSAQEHLNRNPAPVGLKVQMTNSVQQGGHQLISLSQLPTVRSICGIQFDWESMVMSTNLLDTIWLRSH